MRIAQVSPLHESVPPSLYGGTERVVSWLTEELVGLGHDVTLFASADSKTSAKLVPCAERALRLSNSEDPLAHHVLQLEHVRRRARDFDVVHFHVDYVHFPLARALGICHVSTLHGRLDLPDLAPLYREFADAPLVSISGAQRAPLAFASFRATVHHGLPRGLLRERDGSGGYLAFLGRVSPEKGVDRAIAIARATGLPLWIAAKVGDADRQYFESEIEPLLASPRIAFVGEIGDAEKNDFLGNARALLFPIDWPEPFGLVMIEAMACGTPVIAWACGSAPEVIEDGLTGFLVDDVDAAARAVHEAAALDRGAIRRRFEERFTAARMARDYVAVYRRLVAEWPGVAA